MPAMRWSRWPRSCSTASRSRTASRCPGLGKASVDVPGKLIKVDKIMRINKETIDGLIAGGL